jgi:cytochrome d ubiquinol oxidase subunit I
MSAAVITGAFVVTAVGAYWALAGRHREHARIVLEIGVIVGFVACLFQLFPSGDQHGKLVALYQQPGLAAMEGKFHGGAHAEMVLIGQPDLVRRTLDNPVVVPGALSYLAYGSFGAIVKGLDDFPPELRPGNVELLYYAYHIMVGLGTLLIAVMLAAIVELGRGRLHTSRPMLWILMLSVPFPYIATMAGWTTAELGRQPWIVYGLMRTAEGTSPTVSAGSVVFSTLGFMGMYLVMGVLFLYLVGREIARGPAPHGTDGTGYGA